MSLNQYNNKIFILYNITIFFYLSKQNILNPTKNHTKHIYSILFLIYIIDPNLRGERTKKEKKN